MSMLQLIDGSNSSPHKNIKARRIDKLGIVTIINRIKTENISNKQRSIELKSVYKT